MKNHIILSEGREWELGTNFKDCPKVVLVLEEREVVVKRIDHGWSKLLQNVAVFVEDLDRINR
jgi:hypothetical protein